ncbi:MAG: hypothetical protein AMS15_00435 [Planctomycetes bacterium DG_23]|nr:MAG: hypothetical protein AMS15_00435 [Planctomycetes bacterium DG_23]
MIIRIQLTIGVIAFGLLLLVLELIRRGKLREEYSLLWLLTAVVMLVFAFWPGSVGFIAKVTGLFYLTALLVLSFLFLVMILLQFSTIISSLADRNKELAQHLAILKWRIKELEAKEE